MKALNRMSIIFFSIVVYGCATTTLCPFDLPSDDCDRITITAYLPPVVANLDFKDIQGSKDQVIVQGGYQHALSVVGQKKTINQVITPQLQTRLASDTNEVVSKKETILFEFGHSTIPLSELDKLNDFLHRIDSPGLMRIQIEGHTDSIGSVKYNKNLSVKRARAVGFYLIQHGIQQPKISINGFGEDLPLEPNDSETHRAQNRRVKLIPIMSN